MTDFESSVIDGTGKVSGMGINSENVCFDPAALNQSSSVDIYAGRE